MNHAEQEFVVELGECFADLSAETDDESIMLECPKFSLRFSVDDEAFNIHAIKVPNAGARIGSEIMCIVKEFCAEQFLSEIVAKNVDAPAIPFWEMHKFKVADGDEDDYVYRV